MNRRPLARLSTEFVLRRVNRVRVGVFGGDLILALVFAAVTQANVGHIDEDDALSLRWSGVDAPPPDNLRRPVSGYTVALTLGLPRETIRRKINTLVEMGLLRAVETGYMAPAEAHGDQVMVRETLRDSAAARAHFTAMDRAGAVTPQDAATAATRPHLPRMISRASNAYCLAVLEELRRLFDGEMMVGLIFCAIANANARRANAEADEPLGPERPAGPITALALAETVGLPRETARRHIKKLEQIGFCEGGRRGLVIPEPVLSRPAVQATFERTEVSTRRFLRQLALAGVMSPQAETGV